MGHIQVNVSLGVGAVLAPTQVHGGPCVGKMVMLTLEGTRPLGLLFKS